ncbi:hypothetical protein [Geminicoccus flavidas]|uniref:hypothetical protein n=1 Tax=Geminicoccus flavidas TaxID=2506407 RepID=UPI0013589C1F|nr:hypothetical protein [Geminicoccus flavidas]
MADNSRKPIIGPLTEALRSDPRENARRAEETLDAPRRREQEEAMRNKKRATSDGQEEAIRDLGTTRPAD